MAADFTGARPDPLELLIRQEEQRLPWLVPVRHSRMAQNPFAFFRGAATVMASDLARQTHSGLMVQLCGDAHLLNFGFYGSPERTLLFDINDFDETHPGPFEWDVIRLATSLVLAARSMGLSEKQQKKVCKRGLKTYGEAMAEFAAMAFVPMWVSRLDLERLIEKSESHTLQNHIQSVVKSALQRDSRQAVRKLCEPDGEGGLRFRHDPPLIWRHAELPPEWHGGVDWREWVGKIYASYLKTIRPELQHLLSHYRLTDTALKAVGVGSVGTRCAVGVFVGRHPNDVLVLQSKQAEPSVLAPYVPEAVGVPPHEGQRVVEGQRLMQTASDAFLGWTTTHESHHLYWRHFRDWKGSVDPAALDAEGLADYGRLCSWTLAKAHARSGDRQAIAAFIAAPKDFAPSLLEVAFAHADQAEQDHQQLLSAIASGRIEASDII
jgi:hypothetical protein